MGTLLGVPIIWIVCTRRPSEGFGVRVWLETVGLQSYGCTSLGFRVLELREFGRPNLVLSQWEHALKLGSEF